MKKKTIVIIVCAVFFILVASVAYNNWRNENDPLPQQQPSQHSATPKLTRFPAAYTCSYGGDDAKELSKKATFVYVVTYASPERMELECRYGLFTGTAVLNLQTLTGTFDEKDPLNPPYKTGTIRNITSNRWGGYNFDFSYDGKVGTYKEIMVPQT